MTRSARVWLLALAMLVLSSCGGTGFDAAAGTRFADVDSTADAASTTAKALGGTAASTPVDQVTGVLGQTVVVGSAPIGVSAGEGLIWVANSGSDEVSLVDPASRIVVTNIATGAGTNPQAIAVGDQWAVVVNANQASVSLIDVNLRVPGPNLPVGDGADAVIIVSDEAWVTNRLGNSVSVVDLRAQSVTTVAAGLGPEGVTAGNGRVFVANAAGNNVTVFDQTSRVALAEIPVGNGPVSALFHDGQIFVANGVEGTISVINAASLAVEHTFAIFDQPAEMVLGGDGLIWITQSAGGAVSAFNPQTYQIAREEVVGTRSGGIASVNGEVWVTNTDAGSLTIIR